VAKRKTLAADVASKLPPPKPSADAEQVTQSQSGDTLEARSTSRRIKTVEDLLAHIEADMTRFEVAASEATKWECGDGEGGSIELHRVFVRLKPRGGPTTLECVASMIDAAKKEIRRPKTKAHKRKRDGLWSVVVMSDLHMGSRSWRHTTGADYDLNIASAVVAKASTATPPATGRKSLPTAIADPALKPNHPTINSAAPISVQPTLWGTKLAPG